MGGVGDKILPDLKQVFEVGNVMKNDHGSLG